MCGSSRAVYQKLLAAAEADRMSVSAVAERQLEKSLEPVWEEASVTSVTSEVAHVLEPLMTAFEAGLRFGNPTGRSRSCLRMASLSIAASSAHSKRCWVPILNRVGPTSFT